MKCQILFSGKNKKNNIILSSAENAQRVVKVNVCSSCLWFSLSETLRIIEYIDILVLRNFLACNFAEFYRTS